MSDWTDPSPELKTLLDDARRDVPSAERLERVRARLGATLGVADAVPASSPGAPPGPRTWGALAGVAGTAALVVVWLLYAPAPPAPPEPSRPAPARDAPLSAPQPDTAEVSPAAAQAPEGAVVPAAVVPAAVVPAAVLPEPPAGHVDSPAPARVVPPTPRAIAADDEEASDLGSTLREEIALLERAIAARDAGDRAAAREILAQHAARFPRGVLGPERERLLRELAEAPIAPAAGAADPARTP